jgi:hypothetical protein
MSPGFIVIIAIVVIAAIAWAYYAAAQRRKELCAWAHSNGMNFSPAKDHSFDDYFSNFKCLRKGHSRYAYNIMEGQWNDLSIKAFDYHYATGHGKNRSDHYFSAVILASGIPLKPLYIRRERFFDKLTEFIGLDDIDFESAEFSRKFYVKSSDKRWAYDVIHARMMEYLMAAPDFSIQFDLMHIIVWRSQKFKPADFQAAAELIRGILDRLPEYLLKKQIEGP